MGQGNKLTVVLASLQHCIILVLACPPSPFPAAKRNLNESQLHRGSTAAVWCRLNPYKWLRQDESQSNTGVVERALATCATAPRHTFQLYVSSRRPQTCTQAAQIPPNRYFILNVVRQSTVCHCFKILVILMLSYSAHCCCCWHFQPPKSIPHCLRELETLSGMPLRLRLSTTALCRRRWHLAAICT